MKEKNYLPHAIIVAKILSQDIFDIVAFWAQESFKYLSYVQFALSSCWNCAQTQRIVRFVDAK